MPDGRALWLSIPVGGLVSLREVTLYLYQVWSFCWISVHSSKLISAASVGGSLSCCSMVHKVAGMGSTGATSTSSRLESMSSPGCATRNIGVELPWLIVDFQFELG